MKKRSRIVLLIIIAAVLAFAIYVLVYDFPGAVGGGKAPDAPEASADPESSADQGSSTETEEPGSAGAEINTDGISSLWFYNSLNKERYAAFAARMPEIDLEDIVWMVEANLDMQPYSGSEPAGNPESLTVLVNKFFYLEEGFTPPTIVEIDSSMLRKEAADAMEELISVAAVRGFRLWVQSGYRSFSVQKSLYENYTATDGQEIADTYSARPGHSEHQLGLAVDFNTITDAFGETPEGRWAAENSWLFGYIMRYTKENTDITLFRPEPWHFRYIGIERAAHYKELKFTSYEEYWVKYVKYQPPDFELPEDADDAASEEEEGTEG